MKQIIEQEAARRRALYLQALAQFEPVIELIKTASAQGADVSLELRPPAQRESEAICGTLHCRSFHHGVGSDWCDYDVTILPSESTCTIKLYRRLSNLPEEDCDRYARDYEYEYGEPIDLDERDPEVFVWSNKYSSIPVLRALIEEALITDLAERQGGRDALKI